MKGALKKLPKYVQHPEFKDADLVVAYLADIAEAGIKVPVQVTAAAKRLTRIA